MEYFSGVNAELPDDDEETKAEKKAKKDGKELAKKAGILEWLQGDDKPEKKKDEKAEKLVERTESKEDDIVEELDEKEEQVVAEQLVDDHLEAVETQIDLAEPDSEEEAGALSVAVFLEKVGDKLDNGETIDEQALDEAVAETAGDLGISVEELSLEEPLEPEAEGDIEINEETDELTFGEEPETEDDETKPPIVPTGPSSSTTPPPATPTGPTTTGYGSFGPPGGGAFTIPRTPGVTPPTAYETARAKEEKTHSHVPYVLAGGLLGYLIGRRRGRIKTEKRLLPVQKKLEKQVAEMNDAIFKREETIRRLGARHRLELNNISREQASENIRLQRAKRADTLKIYEKSIHKQPEKIGKFALITNANQERQPDIEKAPESRQTLESLSEKQLLEVSKQIHIHGSTLESLFRAGRIELKDLKEIVEEFLRGGSYEKLLLKSLRPDKLKVQDRGENTPTVRSSVVGATRLAELLPELNGTRNIDQHHFGRQKETHIVARVAMVSAGVVLVIMVAIIIALMMLGAL